MKRLLKIINFSIFLFLTDIPCFASNIQLAGKTGGSVLSKFLISSLGVLISVSVIFTVLKLYKKLMLKDTTPSDIIKEASLESPKNFKEAINLFLNKTDK